MAIESSFSQDVVLREQNKLRSVKVSKGSRTKPSARSETSHDLHSNTSSPKKGSSQGESESEDSVTSSSYGSTSSSKASLNEGSSIQGGTERNKSLKKSRSKKLTSSGSFKPSSLRTLRISKNKTSANSKKSLGEKSSEIPHDLTLERATCSSTLKDLKFPKQIELQPGNDESEKNSVIKVCPYHHCSLHGDHRHDAPEVPPKRFVYQKKRPLKTQKSLNTESPSTIATKSSGNRREEAKVEQMVIHGNSVNIDKASVVGTPTVRSNVDLDFSIEFYAKTRSEETFIAANQGQDDADIADILFGVNNIVERQTELKETSLGSCCTDINQDKSLPKAANIDLKSEEVAAPDEKKGANFYKIEGSTASNVGEATENHIATSPSSSCHDSKEASSTKEEKNGSDFEADTEYVNGSTRGTNSKTRGYSTIEVSAAGLEANKPWDKKDNHISMWHMVHQHMVSGLAAEDGNPLPKAEGSDSQKSAPNSDVGTENLDGLSREIEIRKLFAIKIVREAIEKILLPEVQDDQSVTSEVSVDQEFSESNDGEGFKVSSTSSDSAKYNSQEIEENKLSDGIAADKKAVTPIANEISSQEEEKTAKKVGNQSEKRTPKSWSYLKKVILLKRFVKELEKVKKFNPKKPRHFPLKTETEAETVSLRRQMIDEKKNSDEWMLDYALRQVVSELAPTQKRKVALLVKAFETVVPPQEDQNIRVSVPKVGDIRSKGSSQELSANEKDQQIHDHVVPSRNAELYKGNSGETYYKTNNSTADGDLESKSMPNIVPSTDCDPLEQLTAIRGDKHKVLDPESTFHPELQSPVGHKLDSPDKLEKGTEMQNHILMWHMIYQHVATDIAAKVGAQLLFDRPEEENSTRDPGENEGNFNPSHHGLEYSRSDVIKLVREAVDEILAPKMQDNSSDTRSVVSDITTVPEIQDDSSDTRSIAIDIIPDQELREKNEGDDGGFSILNSSNSAKENARGCSKLIVEEERKTAIDGISIPEEKGEALTVGSKLKQQKFKNWSKLKKLILLKRSIKALQQVRELEPQQSLSTSDPETEKVDLRRQMMDERNKAEEWMLDYAVQHMVTKLTPARKARVAMLVEAFEAVVPLPEL